jgi:hypothetical protein
VFMVFAWFSSSRESCFVVCLVLGFFFWLGFGSVLCLECVAVPEKLKF